MRMFYGPGELWFGHAQSSNSHDFLLTVRMNDFTDIDRCSHQMLTPSDHFTIANWGNEYPQLT